MISKHRDHYLITHKSVGVRYLLIIMENGKVIPLYITPHQFIIEYLYEY